jgi:hypothetical protein
MLLEKKRHLWSIQKLSPKHALSLQGGITEKVGRASSITGACLSSRMCTMVSGLAGWKSLLCLF